MDDTAKKTETKSTLDLAGIHKRQGYLDAQSDFFDILARSKDNDSWRLIKAISRARQAYFDRH
jgi:hypothetical protein